MFPQKHFVFGPANINVFNILSRTERLFLLCDATLSEFIATGLLLGVELLDGVSCMLKQVVCRCDDCY